MRLFDTHAHLSDARFAEDLEQILAQAPALGLDLVLSPSASMEDSRAVLELVARRAAAPAAPGAHCRVVGAVGVHPHEAAQFDAARDPELLAAYLGEPGIVALGEIGLDYHYDFSPREVQKAVFRRQLELAHACGKPVILHDREAHGDFLAILRRAAADGLLAEQPGVVHCYSGSWELAQALLDLGFCLGFDGPITFKNAVHALETIRRMPRERLLIETDSPYLAPEPHRGKRNSPLYLPLILAKVAEVWECTAEEAGERIYANSLRLFGL